MATCSHCLGISNHNLKVHIFLHNHNTTITTNTMNENLLMAPNTQSRPDFPSHLINIFLQFICQIYIKTVSQLYISLYIYIFGQSRGEQRGKIGRTVIEQQFFKKPSFFLDTDFLQQSISDHVQCPIFCSCFLSCGITQLVFLPLCIPRMNMNTISGSCLDSGSTFDTISSVEGTMRFKLLHIGRQR